MPGGAKWFVPVSAQWSLQFLHGVELSCNFEKALKCDCAVLWSLYFCCKIQDNSLGYMCGEGFFYLLQTALEMLCSDYFNVFNYLTVT